MKVNNYILLIYFTCIISSILVLPYILSLQNKSIYDLTTFNLFLIIIQNLILYAVIVPLGYYFSKKLNINMVFLQKKDYIINYFINNIQYILGFGIFSFLFIFLFDLFLFKPNFNIQINPLFGFLGSFYGGINEEVINRFFLTSLTAFLLIKIFKNKSVSIWISILTTSIIFGILHLSATALITTLTFKIILRAILLNGIPGIIFGWLYWKKSFELAIMTHFFTDICLHLLLPILKNF